MIAKKCFGMAIAPAPPTILFMILSFFNHIFIILFFLFFVIQIFFLYFFRDVRRNVEDGIISPADGRVMEASRGKISIFMSIFDMHVNLAPYDGKIIKMVYRPGKHKPAYGDVKENEMLEMHIATDIGEIIVRQIAGIFARRIVPYVKEGETIKKGDKIGIIKFGSRVEIMLPGHCRTVVKKGIKIKAGEKIAVAKNFNL